MTWWVGGCSPFSSPTSQFIHVDRRQDPLLARRHTHAAIEALRIGAHSEASDRLTKALVADPGYGPAQNTLGLVRYQTGDLYAAVLAFEEAMHLMPHDAAVKNNLALALESAGKVSEAEELYMEARDLDATNPVYLGNLARLRVRSERPAYEVRPLLEDLVLIERRPQWRMWANRLLVLRYNPALDRGPDGPDLDAFGSEEEAPTTPLDEKIIDLSLSPNDVSSVDVFLGSNSRVREHPLGGSVPLSEPMSQGESVPVRGSQSSRNLMPSKSNEAVAMPDQAAGDPLWP